MASAGSSGSESDFDRYIEHALADVDDEASASSLTGLRIALWAGAAIAAVAAAFGALLVGMGISEARQFGWPLSSPVDRLGQMNLDEALLALPIFGVPTLLVVVGFFTAAILASRGKGTLFWLLPALLVLLAAMIPVLWALI